MSRRIAVFYIDGYENRLELRSESDLTAANTQEMDRVDLMVSIGRAISQYTGGDVICSMDDLDITVIAEREAV